jgi:hypothetical protein
MRYLILFFFALFLIPANAAPGCGAPPAFDAMVILKIQDLDDAMMAKLSAEIGKQRNVTIEYSCTWSDVVVLKMNEISVGERADVITLARRYLTNAGISRGIEYVHVHVQGSGMNKC